MRITGGTAKGQQLKVPTKGRVRPTTDRVREAVFSILLPIAAEWSQILDLYAGTGALGIEALSRDAEWADFVDNQPNCCAIISQNLDRVGLKQKAHVYCCSVTKALAFLDKRYDIIFMDPPYSDPSINPVIMQLSNSKLIDDQTLLVVSHASRSPLQDSYDGLALIKQKRYGDTTISIYHKEIQY
jgi:16S rRNA (guanine966-N2)-methyltransferase